MPACDRSRSAPGGAGLAAASMLGIEGPGRCSPGAGMMPRSGKGFSKRRASSRASPDCSPSARTSLSSGALAKKLAAVAATLGALRRHLAGTCFRRCLRRNSADVSKSVSGQEATRRVRATADNCGDGGGSNSPSKALDRIAPTSVVGDLQSRGPGRAPTRFRSRQPVDLWSTYRAIGGPQPRKFRPSRSAGRRPGGRSLTRQRVRKRCCQLPGAVRIYEGERRSSARSDTFACPVETTHPRDP